MSLVEKHLRIVADLGRWPDADERFRAIIDAGRRFPKLDASCRTDERLVPGCVSRLWLMSEWREGLCYFHMDAEARISKGLAALVCEFYSGEHPADVLTTEPTFIQEIGLSRMISPNRSNGIAGLRGQIKVFAANCLNRTQPPS
ncbi:MAG: SufE family protein [Verrucomicrobia bacterium]|nr:SufE family protein [Verrucomicrobiota bacterium]